MKFLIAAGICTGILALAGLIYLGYQSPWTGFAAPDDTGQGPPFKTLWDWSELLIVPLVLAVAAYALNASRRRSDRRVERDRQRQEVLDKYFDTVTHLILKASLLESDPKARRIARNRTLAALRLLDGGRKAQLLQFIYEAGLIGQPALIPMTGADLSNAQLDGATLAGVELRGVHFRNASLRGAQLINADLRGTDFSEADLQGANVTNAKLVQATMKSANVKEVSWIGASIDQVDFSKARGDTPPL